MRWRYCGSGWNSTGASSTLGMSERRRQASPPLTGVMPLVSLHSVCLRWFVVRGAVRRVQRPLPRLRCVRAVLVRLVSAGRLRRRPGGWLRVRQRSAARRAVGHRWLLSCGVTPFPVTAGDCPRPCPRRERGPTRAGAREAWTRRTVTDGHLVVAVAGPAGGFVAGAVAGRRPAGWRARSRARSAPRGRRGRARGAGSRPSFGSCRTRP